ncbi:hypothetical protein V5279_32005 [Bradyrhizobium sp. 26S5]|uniref:hypothetical protein n=1 Tax=Bradyrhizobium sp. 26S5 TaxID=3139729 RepID=UPI0030D1A070
MLAGQRYPKLLAPLGGGFTRLENHALTGSVQTGLEQAGTVLSGRPHSLPNLRGTASVQSTRPAFRRMPKQPATTSNRRSRNKPTSTAGTPTRRPPILVVRSCTLGRSRAGRATLRARQGHLGSGLLLEPAWALFTRMKTRIEA